MFIYLPLKQIRKCELKKKAKLDLDQNEIIIQSCIMEQRNSMMIPAMLCCYASNRAAVVAAVQ